MEAFRKTIPDERHTDPGVARTGSRSPDMHSVFFVRPVEPDRRKDVSRSADSHGAADANKYGFFCPCDEVRTDLAVHLDVGRARRRPISGEIVDDSNDPPIILADEPIGNLDSANAENVLNLLKEFNEKDGKTIIMVTHEAWSLRDVRKIFYMKDGAIVKTELKKPDKARKPVTEASYRKIFPDLPTLEMKAKAMAGLILRGYSQLEIKRLEYFLSHRFAGKIDKEVFQMVLDRPYNEGGVGLWRQKAQKIADQVEEIIQEEKSLEALYKKLEKEPTAPLLSEVERIRAWLLEDFKLKLSPIQLTCLDEIIGERIRNIITADHFRRVLDLGKEKGGVGFKTRTSFQIADRMEAILGSGGKEALAQA